MTLDTRIAAELGGARDRTLALLDPVPDELLVVQHSPLMSPLVWDLAHIGHYEELWLVRELAGAEPTEARFDDVYDAFKHPRAERPDLDLLGPADARDFLDDVRKRALDVLAGADLSEQSTPLLAGGFVYGMVIRHEHQHDETLLATIQLIDAFAHPSAGDGPGAAGPADVPPEVLVEAGTFTMGTSTDPWAYDNERPAHPVEVPAFRIDTTPVTNAAYGEFVAAGGYDDPRWWTGDGWAWRVEAGLEHPQFWIAHDGGWWRRRFGRVEPLPDREPVQHVCWYEADAYARWRGARLPTEAEWERAAQGATWPIDRTPRFGPDEVGAHPEGASAAGCLDMLGGVWEWTASDFGGYPGFRAFPYREYSEVFFGPEYKVLRGGSWATAPVAASVTFRNWDYPIRRQIFAGFRCARDA
jgi:iron(II)-dependent oxidoreductase